MEKDAEEQGGRSDGQGVSGLKGRKEFTLTNVQFTLRVQQTGVVLNGDDEL